MSKVCAVRGREERKGGRKGGREGGKRGGRKVPHQQEHASVCIVVTRGAPCKER